MVSDLVVAIRERDISTVIDIMMKMSTGCLGGVRKGNRILVTMRKITGENVMMLLRAVVPLHPNRPEQSWKRSGGRQQAEAGVKEPLYVHGEARALQSAGERAEVGRTNILRTPGTSSGAGRCPVENEY